MKRAIRAATTAVLSLLSVGIPAYGADVEAGVATVDITPPKGWRLSGYFVERLNTATHDPLYAKAIVLAQRKSEGDAKAEARAALVFCDLIGMPMEVSSRARRLASEKTGIPVPAIAIMATHTHTGPLFFGPLREHFHAAAIAKHGRDPCEPINYPAVLIEKIVDAIVRANASLRPAEIEIGTTPQAPPLSFNRRYHMKDGSVQFNPGQQNPDIVRAAGPIDPDVGVLLLRDAVQRRAFACLTVFAMHLDTTGGTAYSADYPFYLQEELRPTLGAEFISLFGTGTCGDINHIDVRIKGRRTAEQIGNALARTVLATIPKLRPIDPSRLAVKSVTVDAPLQRYTPEQAAQAAKDMVAIGTGAIPFLREVDACRIADLKARQGASTALEVQVFRLSRDAAIVTLPSEIFVDLGLAIKKASPFRTTLVIELANDAIGYVPTRKAFGEGSYEVVNSRVRSGTGEMLVDAAVRTLKELAAQ
jgi:neutral ceramidase